MTTGERIREARKRLGLTQKELGERLGVSYQAIAQWENDLRNPKSETMRKIAEALECSVADLDAELRKDIESHSGSFHTYMYFSDGEGIAMKLPKEKTLLSYFGRLNEDGKDVALDRVKELSEIPRYQNEDPPQEADDISDDKEPAGE